MVNLERTIQFADLKKQTEYYWWAAGNLRDGPHSGAYWVLRSLQRTGKSELLRHHASNILREMGYSRHAATAEW